MTQVDRAAAGNSGSFGNVAKLSLITLAVIAVGLLIWFLPFGQAIISDSDKRNQRDLAIAASGLETWSDAVRTVAITNFIRGRVAGIENGDRDIADGWTHRARFRHPVLGEYKVLYRVGTTADCQALTDAVRQREGTLPFVRSYLFSGGSMLKVIGDFAVADILRQDSQPFPRNMLANDASPPPGPYIANILNTTPDKVPAAEDLRICYGAVIPLERLLIIDRAAREFANLLVLDSARRIVAQVGSDPIPLKTLDGLAPEGSVLVDTLAASVGQKQDQARKPTALVDSLDPVDLNIAGKTMRAYVRPFHPARFPACTPAATKADTAPPPGECFVVGLMPKTNVWRQIATPPLTLVFGLGLAIGLVIMLLPSLRLMLLGPREAIGKAEAIGIALGIPAAASLATLAVLFATDVVVHRRAADKAATDIATTAADAGRRHLAEALARARFMAGALSSADTRTYDGGFRALEAARLAVPQAPDPAAAATIAQFARQCVETALPRRNARAGRPPDYIDIGLPLAVNPRPLRCAAAPICASDAKGPDRPPLVESIGLYTVRGFAVPGTRTIACRSFFGGRSQIAGRNYFQRIVTNDASLADGGPPSRPYAVDQVMSQPDGLNKTVVAFRADRIPTGYLPGDRQERIAYAVASTVITDLLNPAVLPPYQLMIVDTREDSLPVIMHSAPNRAGAERLATMLDDAGAVRGDLRALVAHGKDVVRFSRFYDGADREFVAAPIPGSRWVVVVHYATNAIDTQPAGTARHALIDWAAMSLLFGVTWVVWLAVVGKHGWADERRLDRAGLLAPLFERGWPRLWPQQVRCNDYIWLQRWLLIAAGVTALVILAVDATGGWSVIAFVAAMLLRTGAGVALHWRLGRPEPVIADRALGPDTQAAFIRLTVALCLCLSVAPMLAFWVDGHRLGRIEQRQALRLALDGRDGEVERADRGLEGIFWSFGHAPGVRHRHAAAYGFDRGRDANDGPGKQQAATAAESSDTTFAGTLIEIAGRGAETVAIPGCTTDGRPRLCGPPGSQRGIGLPEPGLSNLDLTSATGLLGLAVLLALGWHFLVKRVLRDLCGFGIALEAVKYPIVDLKSLWLAPTATAEQMAASGTQTLNRKSLLVNAPWSLLTMLERLRVRYPTPARSIEIFDVSGLQAGRQTLRQPIVAAGKIILVVGLDLVLADIERRLLALAAIEKVVRDIDAATTDALDDPYLLFLSPSAPMDRILDAYEREHPEAVNPDAARENLRWARAFEDFASFQFRPIELTDGVIPALPGGITDPAALATITRALSNPNGRKAIRTVFEELRWLSPRVVNGCINEERYPSNTLLDRGMLPVVDPDDPSRSPFIALYSDIVFIWAAARRFPGRNAALAYIRGQFIEHYQRLWSASTLAERLVMHHIAFGRFVNIRSSLGFAPLVRRGLVVLDPEPRLMNESFAMFVRQAEKLDRIREWQQALPGSAWLKSRLPIFLLLGLGVLALAAMAILAGQDIVALLPVLAAGAPALLAVTQRLLRPAGS